MNKVILHTNNQMYVIEIKDNQIIKSYPDELHVNINIDDINTLISYLQTIKKDYFKDCFSNLNLIGDILK